MAIQQNLGQIFIDIIPDMAFVVSDEHRILAYNQTAREMLNLPLSPNGELVFHSLLTDDSPRPLLAVLRGGNPTSQAEVRFKGRDGKTVDALLFIRKMSGQGTDFLYVVARDISESRQKELDLLRFSSVVHYTANPIQITDARGRMVYVNPAFEKTTGFTKEELIGKNPNIISSGKYSKEFWSNVWAKINRGEVWTGEVENRKKNGEPLYTQLLISPIINADGTVEGFLGSHRDITKQKELERQLLHSQKMESIGTLAAGIAHEVGNPLTSISSIVQVLQRTIDDRSARDKLQLVQSQVHRITKIIRDLVDFSRPSTYRVQPTDVVRTVQEAVEIVKLSKKAKNIRFDVQVLREIPMLSLVPDQLSQVFINMFLNAADAMEDRGGEVHVRMDCDERSVVVSIEDNGSGIAEEHMPKIFEPFFTTKRVGEGTGLGLWVSYGIVKSFRGDISVRSKAGKGTTFTITLPLNPED